jgi:hypothetical protein
VENYGRRERGDDAQHQRAGEQSPRHCPSNPELSNHAILTLPLSLDLTARPFTTLIPSALLTEYYTCGRPNASRMFLNPRSTLNRPFRSRGRLPSHQHDARQ